VRYERGEIIRHSLAVGFTMTSMPQPLDYAPPAYHPSSRLLAVGAHLTLAYPLFMLGSLYGQWLLSWYMLGHRPLPSMDDPKFIDGASWMGPLTGVAILGFFPVGCAAIVLNVLYIVRARLDGARLFYRILALVMLWPGTLFVLRFDPARVILWWLD
jgi:hypothetical protein